MKNKQTCILILGMHRSGTSALAGFLNILDINAGRELMPASKKNNEKGFFENQRVVDFNEKKLFPLFGLSWDSLGVLKEGWHLDARLDDLYIQAKSIISQDYENDDFFLIKDPRICLLFPFWEKVLLDSGINIKIILPFRNPLEVAESLKKRDMFSIEKSLMLWTKHLLYSECYTRNYDRVFIGFDDFMNNTQEFCTKMSDLLHHDFMSVFKTKKEEVDTFLDVGLKHHNKKVNLDEIQFSLVKSTTELFLEQKDDKNSLSQSDKLRLEYEFFINAYSAEFLENKKEINLKNQLTQELKKIVQNREQQVEDRKKDIDKKNDKIQELKKIVQNREQQVEDRKKDIDKKNDKIQELNKTVVNREQQVEDRKKDIDKKNDKIQELNKTVVNREQQIQDRKADIEFKNDVIDAMRIKNRVKALFGLYKRKNVLSKKNKPIVPASNPLVSIIIPFKDKPELLRCVIESIVKLSAYKNYEILCINNNTQDPETFKEMTRLEKLYEKVNFFDYNEVFNFSKLNNYAVKNYAKGEYLVFMNNDIEIISVNWMEALLEHSMSENIGAVGAKLYYKDNTIQHAGVVLNNNNAPIHAYHKLNRYSDKKELREVTEYLAVTAALLMIKREKFDAIDGFDESLAIAYNDVDLCFRLKKSGYKNLFTPHCEAYHYESLSRGYEDTPQKQQRLQKEKDVLISKHNELMSGKDK